MTYCVGILVEDGLVMLADTRTNAGVDNISVYRKLRVHRNLPDRLIVTCSAGNLSTTQAAMQKTDLGIPTADGEGELESYDDFPSIFAAAVAFGRALRASRDANKGLQQSDVNFNATLLVGGSVDGEPLRLFLVYSAGNVIECGPETPYLQVGENKYGKPILDRALRHDTSLKEAVKIGLISFDSTMRSNLAVGMPLDLMVAHGGLIPTRLIHRIGHDDAYFRELSRAWSDALMQARAAMPDPPYTSDPTV